MFVLIWTILIFKAKPINFSFILEICVARCMFIFIHDKSKWLSLIFKLRSDFVIACSWVVWQINEYYHYYNVTIVTSIILWSVLILSIQHLFKMQAFSNKIVIFMCLILSLTMFFCLHKSEGWKFVKKLNSTTKQFSFNWSRESTKNNIKRTRIFVLKSRKCI